MRLRPRWIATIRRVPIRSDWPELTNGSPVWGCRDRCRFRSLSFSSRPQANMHGGRVERRRSDGSAEDRLCDTNISTSVPKPVPDGQAAPCRDGGRRHEQDDPGRHDHCAERSRIGHDCAQDRRVDHRGGPDARHATPVFPRPVRRCRGPTFAGDNQYGCPTLPTGSVVSETKH